MKINATITVLTLDEKKETSQRYFILEARGHCSEEQCRELSRASQFPGAIDVIDWDGIHPIYGLKVILETKS